MIFLKNLRRQTGNRRGMALLDSLFALFLVGIVLIFIIGLSLQARAFWLENKTTALHGNLVQAIAKTFVGGRNYGNNTDLIPVLNSHGSLPDDLVIEGAGGTVSLEHPYGGSVDIVGGPGGRTSRYAVTFNDLDDATCAVFGAKFSRRRSSGSGLDGISINGQALSLPVSAFDVETRCQGGTGQNAITWTYF